MTERVCVPAPRHRGVEGTALSRDVGAARVEGGYRYAVLPTFGVTPYAAIQAQDFSTSW